MNYLNNCTQNLHPHLNLIEMTDSELQVDAVIGWILRRREYILYVGEI